MTAPAPPIRLLLRPSLAADLPAIRALYGWHTEHGSGSFELAAPALDEMTRRRDEVLAKGLPWLVAEEAGTLLGFAYANQFRPRPAYRHALEDSVYVAPEAQGRGIGRLLLTELIARCESCGARQMFAMIGDSANTASIALHRSLGFTDVGTMRAAGWKFERWLDVVILQRALGPGNGVPAA